MKDAEPFIVSSGSVCLAQGWVSLSKKQIGYRLL